MLRMMERLNSGSVGFHPETSWNLLENREQGYPSHMSSPYPSLFSCLVLVESETSKCLQEPLISRQKNQVALVLSLPVFPHSLQH